MPRSIPQFLSISLMVFIILSMNIARASDPVDTQAARPETNDDPGFYYTIQKGDTLWDLSKKFYHSQWVWPGLWEMNDQFKNPHWIYPGQRIRVYLDPTRSSRVTDQGSPAAQAPATPPEPSQEICPTFSYSGMAHAGFIRETAVTPVGRILKSDDDEIMIAEGYHIFIEPMGPETMIPDRLYAIYTTEVITRDQASEPQFKGIKHTIKGIIRILENNQTVVTGTVLTSFRDLAFGDLIMPFNPQENTIVVEQPLEALKARILCQDDPGLLMSDYSIAFMDKGDRDNVKPGQLYTIFREQNPVDSTTPKKSIQLPPLEMGKLIVIRTEDIASTVLILSSTREIPPGALVN